MANIDFSAGPVSCPQELQFMCDYTGQVTKDGEAVFDFGLIIMAMVPRQLYFWLNPREAFLSMSGADWRATRKLFDKELGDAVIRVEAAAASPIHQRFCRFFGFTEQATTADRIIYTRPKL